MRKASFLVVCLAALLSGCASAPSSLDRPAASPLPRTTEAGMTHLAAGQLKEAHAIFNSALARAPADANLHFLNGLSYQQLAQNNVQTGAELAETGYKLALEFDPNHWLAAWHLGLLQLEQRQYAAARKSLGEAAILQPRHGPILLALAGSAYRSGDVPVALWAAENALALQPDDAEALRIASLASAALGLEADATMFGQRLERLDPTGATTLRERSNAWRHSLTQAPITDPTPSSPPSTPANEASLPIVPIFPVAPADEATASPGTEASPASTTAISAGGFDTASSGTVAPHWSDCVQAATSAPSSNWSNSWGGSSWGNTTSDATERLPALPAPCKGVPLPRMAVVDITLIRSLESSAYKQGVNLLDGLKVVLGGAWTRYQSSDSVSSRTITRSLGLPANGIIYSLNIFNSADTKAEVIARPSLLALDRTPSTFFSGATLSVALRGENGGSLSDKNIGVSLSVTPTFIDDQQLLLAVKAARSFIEPAQFDGFDEALTSANNTVFANAIMRFGDTLILSGLHERENTLEKSGVPLLRDLPLVQHLFSHRSEFEYMKHVLILLTPRKPAALDTPVGATSEQVKDEVRETAMRALRTRQPNLDAVMAHLQQQPRYRREFLDGGLSARRFAPPPSLERVLTDIRRLIHY